MLSKEDTTTNLSAELQLKPKYSQISIVILLIMSGVFGLIACYFLWNGKPTALPTCICIATLAMAGFGWIKSHMAIDLGNSFPTTFSNSEGFSFSTDTRAIENPNTANQMYKLIQTFLLREPLPPADGIISSGKIMPNTSKEAVEKTENINNKININIEEITSKLKKGLVEVSKDDEIEE